MQSLKKPALCCLVLAINFIALPLRAQDSAGALSGKITTPAGAPVVGAKVSLKNRSTGQSREAETNQSGAYEFDGLTTGDYDLSVSALGFTSQAASVTITQNQTFDLRLEMLSNPSGPSLSDLGFPTAETQSNPAKQALLDRRTHMLRIHQKMGLITAGPLLATILTGFTAGGKQTSSSTRDLHAALGSTTAGLYFTTAYFAIRAPRIEGTETRGPIRVHKALAWIHGPGMILTPILGAIAFDQKSKGEKVHGIASLHGPVAIITGAAYGAAMLSVSVKF